MMMEKSMNYTTQLQAGLGLIDETKILLELWQPGMTVQQLSQKALDAGRFPTVTARRLRNIVAEAFAPRYMVEGGKPANQLKKILSTEADADISQLMFLYTCRANPILADFVRQVYWQRYAGGYSVLHGEDARVFVERAIAEGKTGKRWAESTVRRISAYLMGCCADFGLLESGSKSNRRVVPFRIATIATAYLAYELHFAGLGDNAVLMHEDWQLYGLDREDVLAEIKRLSLKGLLLVQVAGDAVRISWKYPNMEVLCDVLTQC